MRPLKRPMFKTGGPIKEGVMNGLRDGGVATTMADATGYAGGGMAMLPPMRGRVTGPGMYSQPPLSGYVLNQKPQVKTGRLNIGVPNQGKITQATGKMANFYDKGKTFVKSPAFSEKGIADLAKKYVPKAFGTVKNVGKGILTRFPAVSSALGMEYVTRPNEYEKVLNEQMNYGPYESRFRKSLDFTYRKKLLDLMEKQPELFDTARGITPKKKTDKGNTGNVPDAVKNPPKTQAEIAAEKEIKDKQKLDRIYNLLGVKRAQANAASKALIDMSRYIDEGGKDVISKKNLGSTISKAIGAFDKRLDKADQLKEAAGLMMAKGEIEAMSNPNKKKLQELQIELGEDKLRPGVNSTLISSRTIKKGALTEQETIDAVRIGAANEGSALLGSITSDQIDDGNYKGKTVIDIVTDLKPEKNGYFVIGKSIVKVESGVPKLISGPLAID